jgi:hypothetical protein
MATTVLDVLNSDKKKMTVHYIEDYDAKALKKLGFKMKAFKWVDEATACQYCPQNPIPKGCCDADGKKRRIGYEISRSKSTETKGTITLVEICGEIDGRPFCEKISPNAELEKQ